MRTLSKIQMALLTVVIMVVIPFSTYAVDGQRKISQTPSTTFPIVINQPGSYVLTSNLAVTDPNQNAIEITVNDVTLDLNGHMIQGPHTGAPWGGSGNGIYALNKYNITIKNGRIWGFGGNGVMLDHWGGDPSAEGAGHYIEKIQASNNGDNGIDISVGVVNNCTFNNNGGYGINADDCTITYCMTSNNVLSGILADSSSISNCTANYCGLDGIMVDKSSIVNCSVYENARDGIRGQDSNITNCAANNNGNGFSIWVTSITNCTATWNEQHGINAEDRNRIEGNNLRDNGQGGTGYGLAMIGDNKNKNKNVASLNTSGNFLNSGSNNVLPFTGDTANYWPP
jgi:hypothetical protein